MNATYLQDKMLDAVLDERVDNTEDLLLMMDGWKSGSARETKLSENH